MNNGAPLVKIHIHEHTGTLILNRPDKRNALTRGLIAELTQALDDLRRERRVRTVVIAGSGSAFCAGMDLNEMQQTAAASNSQELWYDDATAYRDLLEAILQLPKPIIAAVGGPAVAGGAGLALACDIVLAAPEAKFGLPEPKRGIVAGLVAPLLVFRLGAGRAAYLLLSAQLIPAEEAFRMGIYHELIPGEKLWPRAHQLAGEIADCAPEAMLLTKRMLNETIGENLNTLLTAGAAVSATARTTEAAAEGLAAFIEKREPKFL
ncbi:MAG TPA: enoyl-CoA hydratase/isomerase family protein [Pirellulales bacterium]|jgi:enoyl-CoA hydratase/carnithine racemase|nr:enoyl-CoA hydratase/isomerase family protein [Pirellulales bacterium]